MGKVIELHECVAACPECKGQLWYLHLDKMGHNFENIIAHECVECGFRVDFDVRISDGVKHKHLHPLA